MAAPATKPVSNIAVAFATQSASVPIPRDGGHVDHPTNLLTPPNSISPTLPPHNHRPDILSASRPHPPSQVDSDIDLQDAVEHAAAQGQPALSREALSGLEAAGQITPAMLAKHHLPDVLLGHGAMAIRHVLNQLAQVVPGFSQIPPAKARRLVVAALESRGGGGLNGDVEFEKVGWGRWCAHKGPRDPRDPRAIPIDASHSGLSPPASVSGSYAVSSVGGLQIPQISSRYRRDLHSGSWAGDSMLSSRDEEMTDMNYAEHEADKMSLDGSEDSVSDSSEMADDIPGLEDDLDDVTDHEDWAAIDPDALRQGSYSSGHRMAYRDYNYLSRTSGARMKPPVRSVRSVSAQSVPLSRAGASAPAVNNSSYSASRGMAGTLNASTGVMGTTGQDPQEREAIAALLSMGSM
ncbi:hypothetical protein K469DRAFT_723163 [Zopfia rhizophila CBS 207.26]|uniref:Sin3 binding protein-domain-containing protein n=1 Tax=Zopfia rhizophila CBS 207.26 TaxID=1314779 RepID=A0A6A6DA92_9PEZI|nr:hypothetical protein K469DRAFT_723163 [Zopfia rhizophila CBS 207.26]